jgi:hypothetical protein
MRPLWTRALTLYRDGPAIADAAWHPAIGDPLGPHLHARSRFRSSDDPDCFALYSVRDAAGLGFPAVQGPVEEHTLIVVREFRRVPLDASGLGLMLFAASPGRAARVIAALAHWVERAVSVFQPNYLLLAHSLEHPSVAALLAGVHAPTALQAAGPTALSLDTVLPEIGPLLEGPPDRYVYCPEEAAALLPRLV